MNDYIIQLKDIDLSYKTKYQVVELFKHINLNVRSNEYLVITGKSGSGKSSILNLVSGFLYPTNGSIEVDGKNINQFNQKELSEYRNKKIGYVFQFFNLIYQFTVLENVMVPLLIRGISKQEAKEEALKLLEQVELENRSKHFPNELSGGEQQRVAIARALANNPDIILADEPTGNLDATTGNSILNILDHIHTQGKTVLLVTHDEDVARRATRVLQMKDILA
jgi:putative ABC transport system ATP-binding protein